MSAPSIQSIGTDHRQGSPTIEASRPGATYLPRLDQILAVMKKNRGMTVAVARERCIQNFIAWRDKKRKWKFIQSAHGTYVQVEDR